MNSDNTVNEREQADYEDPDELKEPYNELEAFDSLWQAIQWNQIRKRLPKCFKKTLKNRYMLANIIYLGYTIGLLIIDFHPDFYGDLQNTEEKNPDSNNNESSFSLLEQPIENDDYVNRVYIGLAFVNLIIASLYWWAWRGRSSLDVIMIPEYLNHIQAALYIWSAFWYSKQDTIGGHYTMAVHYIEMSASFVELSAAIGWMISWHMTYTRTLGRGFTLDDPDTVAYLSTTTNTLLYLVYNTTMVVSPEQYGSNYLYTYADILGFVGACFYIFANLRDDSWFWFLPLAGQYGVAAGKIRVEGKILPQFGKKQALITDICRRKSRVVENKVEIPKEIGTEITSSYH